MKEEPTTDGEVRATFKGTCLLRVPCRGLFTGCQEHTVNKALGLSLKIYLPTGKREGRILL